MADVQNGRNGTHTVDAVPVTERTVWQKICAYCKYISVEPLVLCWLVPSLIGYIAIENLQLQKACRVNFNNTEEVCRNMIDKTINDISCGPVLEKIQNLTTVLETAIKTNSSNITSASYPEYAVTELERLVCQAEVDSQSLDAKITGYMAPIESTFAILMILFAAGWSDRRGLRKPCMLLPMLGELGATIANLIAAIFFDQLPMEFNSILVKLLPAIGGKENLMLMAIFTYLTDTTPEKDRTFRFGIFAVFVQILPSLFLSFAGALFQWLQYIKLFLLCIIINISGIIYLLFVLKEVKRDKKDHDGVDNPAFEKGKRDTIDGHNSNGRQTFEIDEAQKPRSCLADFFNPIVAVECFRLIARKRMFSARNIVLFILVLYFICVAPIYGEATLEYNFVRIKLDWGGELYSPLNAFSTFAAMIGTIVLIGGASKILKLADAWLGFISAVCSAISRLILVNATSSFMMYASKVADMFAGARVLTLKSIMSVVVEQDEIGKVFSIMAILESIGNFISVPIYTKIYQNTLSTWPSAFFIFSFALLVAASILFAVLYFIIKRFTKSKDAYEAKNEVKDGTQITHM